MSNQAPSWMLKGATAAQAIKADDAKRELAKQEMGKLWRYFMKDGDERRVSFLDGSLRPDGMLDVLMFYEHEIMHANERQTFLCTGYGANAEPCPICAGGDRPYLAGVFTVIDHTPYTVQSGKNAGKTYENRRKLYVAKTPTLKLLTKIAEKRQGLAGATFDVLRTGGDKSPRVGTHFEFLEKRSPEQLKALYGDAAAVADYSHEFVYRTAEELVKLGVGQATKGVGYEKSIDKKSLDEAM